MNFMHSIRADLVDKRLLPVVALLAALVILVPVGVGLTSKSSSSTPVLGPPPATTPPPGAPSPAKALAAVAGPDTPVSKHYTGRELDPFRQRPVAATAAATPAKTAASTGSGSAVKTGTTTITATTTPVVTTKTTPVTTTPVTTTTTTPVATPSPKAQLAKLRSRDSYSVDMNVADATGPRTLTGVERLSPLPSATNPLSEYLGVLKSGRAASFLLNQGTIAEGPGQCLPTVANCQVLVLKPGQIETLGVSTASGPISEAAIAITNWRVVTHSTVTAARKARAVEVPQGRTLVTQSHQPALTDLVYSVAQGVVSVIPALVNAVSNTLSTLLGG